MRKLKPIQLICTAAGLALAALILAQSMIAQRRPSGFGGDDRDDYEVTCQSFNGRRKVCGSHPGVSVRLSQQISRQACVEGQTWGMEGDRLWVDEYCGATFTLSDNSRGRNSRIVTCQSTGGRRVYCGSYPDARVSLNEQLSRASCVEDRSWGVDNRGLWTDDNCGATFRIQERGNRTGQRPAWWSRDPNDTWPPRGAWRGRNWDRGGACFYKDVNYGGEFFCLERGEDVNDLHGDNDKVSSMRLFGGARVSIYEHNDFRGINRSLTDDVRNFREVNFSGGRDWNDRISSIRVD